MEKKHLVFDVDGTIVQIPVDWNRVLSEVEELLGYRPSGILPVLRRLYGTPLYNSISSLIEKYELKALSNLRILDNSPTVIAELAKRYPIHVVTMQSRRVAYAVLRLLGLTDIPSTLITRDDTGFREHQLKLILDKTGVYPNQIIFIADKVLDMTIAYKLGIQGVLVARKLFNPQVSPTDNILEDMETLGIIVVSNLKELLSLL